MACLAFNPSIQEGEKGQSLRVQGQLGPHSEFQVSHGHTVRPSQKQEQPTALVGWGGWFIW